MVAHHALSSRSAPTPPKQEASRCATPTSPESDSDVVPETPPLRYAVKMENNGYPLRSNEQSMTLLPSALPASFAVQYRPALSPSASHTSPRKLGLRAPSPSRRRNPYESSLIRANTQGAPPPVIRRLHLYRKQISPLSPVSRRRTSPRNLALRARTPSPHISSQSSSFRADTQGVRLPVVHPNAPDPAIASPLVMPRSFVVDRFVSPSATARVPPGPSSDSHKASSITPSPIRQATSEATVSLPYVLFNSLVQREQELTREVELLRSQLDAATRANASCSDS